MVMLKGCHIIPSKILFLARNFHELNGFRIIFKTYINTKIRPVSKVQDRFINIF